MGSKELRQNTYLNNNTTMMQSTTPRATVWEFTYTYDPYNTNDSVMVKTTRSHSDTLPDGTLHMELQSRVSFMPYPNHEFHSVPTTATKDQMVRLFIGQLPYQVTDMQLEWLCYTFGQGANVHFPERIVKKDKMNPHIKIPTGCVHVYVEPQHVDGLMNAMHKRVLIDDTGVWYAQTSSELVDLESYTTKLKTEKKKRFQFRPYDSVVVQHATSTFVPPPPTYNASTNSNTASSVTPQRSLSPQVPQTIVEVPTTARKALRASPPPPSYFYPPQQQHNASLECTCGMR